MNRYKGNSSHPLHFKAEKNILSLYFSKIVLMSGRGPLHAQPHECAYVCQPSPVSSGMANHKPNSIVTLKSRSLPDVFK